MSISVRRKRHSRDLRCILFPDDIKDVKTPSGKRPVPSTSKSWEQCGDGFLDVCLQKTKIAQKKTGAIKETLQTPTDKDAEDLVNIAWSSSESEQSGPDEASPSPWKGHTPRQNIQQSKYRVNASGQLQLLSSETDMLSSIEVNSDGNDGEDESHHMGESRGKTTMATRPDSCDSACKPLQYRVMASDVDITDYPSDIEESLSEETTSSKVEEIEPNNPLEGGRRSFGDWIRSAQVLLQTPQKQANGYFKTPDDSHKKRRKFESGGFAERLKRLQARQRSAISFWRHQSTVDNTTTGKPGVLALQLLHLEEDSGLTVALCQQLSETPLLKNQKLSEKRQDPTFGQQDCSRGLDRPVDTPHNCIVLFSRETTTHLAPRPGDTIHVHPPWQTLMLEGRTQPFILNAHFSQKVVLPGGRSSIAPSSSFPCQVSRCNPYNLNLCWGPWLGQQQSHVPASSSVCRGQADPCMGVCPSLPAVCESVLEALESLSPAGALSQRLEVVIQRVYCLPIPQSPAAGLRRSPSSRSPCNSSTNTSSTIGRLCVLVQDACGMFSEVQLQTLSCEGQMQLCVKQWEGRSCLLHGVKVLQRITRDRCASLFTLIDSLWPPSQPLRVHGDLLNDQQGTAAISAPSFCYRLCGSEVSVVVSQDEPLSPLYKPPLTQRLRQILQDGKEGNRCSFTAHVVFAYSQASSPGAANAESWLLFVTDGSLQGDEEAGERLSGCWRTLPVSLNPSFKLQHSIRQALITTTTKTTTTTVAASRSPCILTFTDVLWQQSCVVCLEQSSVRLAKTSEDLGPLKPLPLPVLLDPLGPATPPNTLCTLTGVVVGVDEETAFSWPVCNLCGSDRLERAPPMQNGFLCTVCGETVVKPTIKMQLEVYLNCEPLTGCTVKIKLQQTTIAWLLSSLGTNTELYEVDSVLGKELGPISAYVRLITKEPSLWVGLEEVCL